MPKQQSEGTWGGLADSNPESDASCAVPAAMLALLIGLQFYLKLQARWLGPCPCHSLYHPRGGTCVLSSLNSPESGSSFCHPLGTLRVTPCLQSPSTAMERNNILTQIIVCAAGPVS